MEKLCRFWIAMATPRMVTAADFEYGMRRTMTPATAADYAWLLGTVIQGAQAFIDGETDDFSTVGVKAIDATTLEMTFIDPAVYNLSIAGSVVQPCYA